MSLKAAMKRRAGQMRYRCLEGVEAVVERQRNATMMASSSSERDVDPGSLGPVGKSTVEMRLRHLATVLGLIPWRLASALRLS